MSYELVAALHVQSLLHSYRCIAFHQHWPTEYMYHAVEWMKKTMTIKTMTRQIQHGMLLTTNITLSNDIHIYIQYSTASTMIWLSPLHISTVWQTAQCTHVHTDTFTYIKNQQKYVNGKWNNNTQNSMNTYGAPLLIINNKSNSLSVNDHKL